MVSSRRQIESLVVRVQGAFLDEPGLALSITDAQRRFGLDRPTSEAVLAALAEAGVVARTPAGRYARFWPHGTPSWPVLHVHMPRSAA